MKKIESLIDDIKGNTNIIKQTLEINAKPIGIFHMNIVTSILSRIYINSKKYNVPIDKIPVFNYRFLPEDFEEKMHIHLDNYVNPNVTLNDIWEVSKCRRIVMEYRRRLLYKNISGDDFEKDYSLLFNNIKTEFVNFIKSKKIKEIECHEEYEIPDGIYGELDLRIDDTIIDYKTTQNNDMNLEWIVQLLCYKVLCDTKTKINKIAIFNPLKGTYSEMDVSNWTKHKDLVAYLLQKRDYIMRKYTSSSST
jgi:hypothetical protein